MFPTPPGTTGRACLPPPECLTCSSCWMRMKLRAGGKPRAEDFHAPYSLPGHAFVRVCYLRILRLPEQALPRRTNEVRPVDILDVSPGCRGHRLGDVSLLALSFCRAQHDPVALGMQTVPRPSGR